ncbi:MAG: tRNA uridine-5-carboxymethylaminomethyl(34) synthesis GTPase MnmE [Paramuribaculum sp.]|nr:tRNA uridine-5-carboxymethylaminomethyl(34) synthesis GTPase MnmE [Paramuribaculum sp.]
MIHTQDTICAISTAPGIGGIAVIRVSGPTAFQIVEKVWMGRRIVDMPTHTAHLGSIVETDGSTIDQAVLTIFRAPGSYTGEDTVELSIHGSRFVQRRAVELLIEAGARLAEAGEFTRRAFVAGHLDLAQAEAVADVIASNSKAAHRIAMNQMRGGFSQRLAVLRDKLIELASLLELELDFSEEEVEFASRHQLLTIADQVRDEVGRLHRSFESGQAIKEGIPVAIVGPTNAGKSSLLNALLGDDRAIVSNIPGTTRDTIEETLEIGEYLFRFIDTAGLRHTKDEIERIGIDRSRQAIKKARIVIAVTDINEPITQSLCDEIASVTYRIWVLNKVDLIGDKKSDFVPDCPTIELSAKTGKGIERLREALLDAARQENGNANEGVMVSNLRHALALENAYNSIQRVIEGLQSALPGDLVAQDLRDTIHHLGAITGTITTPDILQTIFSRFCIGK